MVQRTVLKVNIACLKCKRNLLKAVAALQGVDKVEADTNKGTLTVIGDADPYEIILQTRKAGKIVDVISVGPPPAPPKKDEKKDPPKKTEEKKPNPKPQVHHNHPVYEPVVNVPMGPWDEPNQICSIM